MTKCRYPNCNTQSIDGYIKLHDKFIISNISLIIYLIISIVIILIVWLSPVIIGKMISLFLIFMSFPIIITLILSTLKYRRYKRYVIYKNGKRDYCFIHQ